MLRLAAQMQERDKDKFIARAQENYRLEVEKVPEFDKHIFLAMTRLTAGIAREIVDFSKTAGEAWHRLTDQFYGRIVQGATAIVSQLQGLKRPVHVAESFHLLNVSGSWSRICSTISKRTNALRHPQSGLHQSGLGDRPQSDGNTSRRRQS